MKYFLLPIMYDEWEKTMGSAWMQVRSRSRSGRERLDE